MKKILIDTNILFQLFKKNVSIDNLKGFELIIPDFIKEEFIYKAKENKLKNLDVFFENLNKNGFKFLETNYKLNKDADDLLIKLAKELNAYILTIDKKLKRKCKKEGILIKSVEKKGRIFSKEDVEDFY